MAKGFAIAITVTMILVIMLLYMQNFSSAQNADLNRIAQLLASEKVIHTWSDVNDDFYKAANLRIERGYMNVTFFDSLPAGFNLGEFLHLYGIFIDSKYETPDVDITYLDEAGKPTDLRLLPAKITIKPYNIVYYYDDWSKHELFVKIPEENYSIFNRTIIHLNFSESLECTCNDDQQTKCAKFDPNPKDCKSGTTYCINITLSISDASGFKCTVLDGAYDFDSQIKWNFHIGGEYLQIPMRMPIIIDMRLQNIHVNTSTTLILNTNDFYISYPAQLSVSAVNYNTSRIDNV
jgi:hypothetical protein